MNLNTHLRVLTSHQFPHHFISLTSPSLTHTTSTILYNNTFFRVSIFCVSLFQHLVVSFCAESVSRTNFKMRILAYLPHFQKK